MAEGYVVRENRYYDSVFLMQIARRISEETSAEEVAALMGTPSNKDLLSEIGFQDPIIQSASPNDLVIALRANNQDTVDEILVDIDRWLARPPRVAGRRAVRTLSQALSDQPQTNLVVISLPGAYAAKEAEAALEDGRNVFLFSNNVSIEDEVRLKQRAQQQGLIVMGPDCGTAIIGGAGIGLWFARDRLARLVWPEPDCRSSLASFINMAPASHKRSEREVGTFRIRWEASPR